ncbi:MAG: hypothetical protein IPP07_29770 [Holophagales bacterium]|nr:hypothetical protein [Holophagales bacterium]
MKPYEIFRRLSSSEIDALVLAACEDDEIPDKIAGGVLSLQRVPLTRFERFTEDVRKGYVRKTLRDKRQRTSPSSSSRPAWSARRRR